MSTGFVALLIITTVYILSERIIGGKLVEIIITGACTLLTLAFLANIATVWILVKFHPVRSVRTKVYLATLSIPIVAIYGSIGFVGAMFWV